MRWPLARVVIWNIITIIINTLLSIQYHPRYNTAVKMPKLRRVELLMELHLTAMECHLPYYGITQCYPPPDTSEHTPHLNPSQTGWYSIYLPRRDGRLSWPRWLVTYRDGLSAHRRSPIKVLTRQHTGGWELNSRSVDHKSDALSTIVPSLCAVQYYNVTITLCIAAKLDNTEESNWEKVK